MSFVKEKVNTTPIEDTVFAIVKKAKEAKAAVGAEKIVDATIGSLYNEEGTIVAFGSCIICKLFQVLYVSINCFCFFFHGTACVFIAVLTITTAISIIWKEPA